MSFKKNKYIVIKQAISKELASFICNYFTLKRDVMDIMYGRNLVNPTEFLGTRDDPQVPGVYSHYADIAMETLLTTVLPIMEKKIKLKLIPTYSYARIYEKGADLLRHKDRNSCEISTTLNLGGDPWPIYIDPTGKNNITKYSLSKPRIVQLKPTAHKGIRVDLGPGDMLVYKGCDLEHWREPFSGEKCVQVFLHYNDKNGNYKDKNKFDGRFMLGLPSKVI